MSRVDAAIAAQLSELVAQLCDNDLSEDDAAHLNAMLNEHPGARQYYLRYIAVHNALTAAAGNPLGFSAVESQLAIERLTIERFAGCFANNPTNRLEMPIRRQGRTIGGGNCSG